MNFRYKQIIDDILVGLILLAVYFIAGKIGLSLASINENASAVWPPTGIAVAALLMLGYRFWPVIFVGAFLVNLTTSGLIPSSLGIALGNTLEALLGVYFINRFAGGTQVFQKPNNIFRFALFTGFIATAVSATFGVSTLLLSGLASAPQLSPIWLTWWLGDMGGALIIAPLLLIWTPAYRGALYSKTKLSEAVLFWLTLTALGWLVFRTNNYPLDFLFIPLLVWVSFRLGLRSAATAIAVLSSIAIWGTLHGFGPFVTHSQNTSLLLLQTFMIIVGVSTLAVTSLIAEINQLDNDLIGSTARLAQEKAEDDALLTSIGEGIVATDEQGRITHVNTTFEDLLGWRAEEVIGKATTEILSMKDNKGQEIPEQKRPLNQAVATGKKVTTVCYLTDKNGRSFPAAITASPLILDGKSIGGIKVFRDVSVETGVDRAKSEFVSLASHQLRTPLTVIKWRASRLLEDWRHKTLNKRQQKQYLEGIYQTNERMTELVNALLNVSKIDLGTLAIEPENVNITKIADNVLAELKEQIRDKQLVLKKEYQPNLPRLSVDPHLTRIIFQNLFTNAIKYTPKHGHISCKIRKRGKNLLLEVTDTGCGIPKADYRKIFTKFYRTDSARRIDPNGNGLGMYIVKAILDQTKGNVWLHSVVNKGTTFYVTIPLSGMKQTAGVKSLTESYS